MRRVLLIVTCVAVFLVLAFVALPKYEVSEHIETGALGKIESDNISQLWFSPAEELVGVAQDSFRVTIRVWSGRKGALLRERALELGSAKGVAKPTFAVSGDGSKIAWVTPAGVHVESPFTATPEKAADFPFSKRVPITSLAFTGSAGLAILYQDGELELLDMAVGKVTASKSLGITDPGPLIATSAYLATYSLSSHDAFVFDTGSADRLSILEHSKYPADMLSVTLSPKARLAMGTNETVLVEGVSIPAPGAVHALAFYDRSRVFAGGSFPGIFLLSPSSGTMQAATSNPGTTVLAATESLLAFGTSRSVSLFTHRIVQMRVYKGLSWPSPWLAIAFLGLLSPVAIPLFRTFWNEIWKRILRILLQEPETKPKLSGQDDSIPSLLVEACQNGDCVLYAGAGFSAQAGLPLWNECVRELVKWAAENDLAPAAVMERALDEVSRDQTGAAADRIAAALQGRELALHTYLRRRFHVATEISPAHRLIKQIDFPALVTTNLDDLLDRTFPYSGGRVYTARDCESLATAAARRDFFLLKPFGDLDEPDTLHLGPAQCESVIEDNPACSDFIAQLLNLRTFLFMGASLEGIERDLGYFTPGPIERKHYAFIAVSGDGWKDAAERLSQRFGIQVITYSPSSASHPEVVDFLTRLHAAMRERTSTQQYFTTGEST
jgi:SIR2-like domain